MTQAVRDLSQKDCQKEIFNAVEAFLLDLVMPRKTSSNNCLEIKLSQKEHALLSAELFMISNEAAGLTVTWRLNSNSIKREYQAYCPFGMNKIIFSVFTVNA